MAGQPVPGGPWCPMPGRHGEPCTRTRQGRQGRERWRYDPDAVRSPPDRLRERTRDSAACSRVFRGKASVPEGGKASVPEASAPLRLTRRGRAVVAGMAMILVGASWLPAAGAARAAGGTAPPGRDGRSARQVVVEPGETLWSIAKDAAPGTDTRIIVRQMMQLNDLSGPRIMPGEHLLVPRG